MSLLASQSREIEVKPAFRLAFRFGLLMTLTCLPLLLWAQTPDLTIKNIFATGDKSSLPIEFGLGVIFVPVRLNGSRPLAFVLDTGSTRMLVERTLANGLGLKPSGRGSLRGP
jgi:hypothetical protein